MDISLKFIFRNTRLFRHFIVGVSLIFQKKYEDKWNKSKERERRGEKNTLLEMFHFAIILYTKILSLLNLIAYKIL